jgi:cytochrome c oxidase assembly protein subunit 11
MSLTARSKGKAIALACGLVAVLMVGAAYAAVPLYKAFCAATGFDGTTKREEALQGAPLTRKLTIRFDTNVRGDLPWTFKAEQKTQQVAIGTPGMAFFTVKNEADHPVTGRAIYNVVPESAGAYFVKTQCFCFDDQTIPAHTEMRFPVIYFVQPEFARDRETFGFQEVTLSYTFFKTPDQSAAKRLTAAKASAPLGVPATPRL